MQKFQANDDAAVMPSESCGLQLFFRKEVSNKLYAPYSSHK